jgi:hypothetical protein
MKTGDHILRSEQHATRSLMRLLGPDEDIYFTIHPSAHAGRLMARMLSAEWPGAYC